MKKNLTALLLATSFIFTGCASNTPNINNLNSSSSKLIDASSVKKKKVVRTDSIFEKKRKVLLSNIIDEAKIPLKTPDVILRVLTLPYTDKNTVLHSNNYQFVKVADGQWILGDYIKKEVGNTINRTFTPLKKSK